MFAAARLGDLHLCPIPGHGTTPIVTASATSLVNGKGRARVGDVCGCGAALTVGIPSILIDGRPMAYLGSPTSHGGTLISGSPDTFGGLQGGKFSHRVIIDFAKLNAVGPDGMIYERRMATLLADPRLTEIAKAAGAIVDPQLAASKPVQPTPPCTHPDRMEELAAYIAEEMNRNINHPSVLEMKALNSFDPDAETAKYNALPFYLRLGQGPDFHSLARGKQAKALALWTERVGQNREWDHKPKIKAKFAGDVWHKQGNYDYFYDIWSNIHYGYVGIVAGLSESVLLDGAGAEQIISDTLRKADEFFTKPKDERTLQGPHPTASPWSELRSWDDIADRVAIGIGVKLANRHSTNGVTAQIVMNEVLSVTPEHWGEGVRDHECA